MVAMESGCEVLGTLGGGVVGVGAGPLMQFGLDEAFGFAVASEYAEDGYPESE